MNTPLENNVPLLESDEQMAERIMGTIIEYADEQKCTAQEIEEAFSMAMTEDSSEDGLKPEVIELRNLMGDVKTNQLLNDAVRNYILAAYRTETGMTFN